MALELQPVTFAEAAEFIRRYHRHHPPTVGYKFAVAVNSAGRICGVITVGRPVARHQDDGYTAEITRCCTDGTKNAASMLYGAATRAARALGYRRVITYTLKSESGVSLRASGYRVVWEVKGASWSREGRPRVDRHPLEDKLLWEAA